MKNLIELLEKMNVATLQHSDTFNFDAHILEITNLMLTTSISESPLSPLSDILHLYDLVGEFYDNIEILTILGKAQDTIKICLTKLNNNPSLFDQPISFKN